MVTKIPKEGSDKDITLSETEPLIVEICEFCKTNPCDCRFLICPFHGKVNAKEDGENFRCPIKNCEIKRTKKELES